MLKVYKVAKEDHEVPDGSSAVSGAGQMVSENGAVLVGVGFSWLLETCKIALRSVLKDSRRPTKNGQIRIGSPWIIRTPILECLVAYQEASSKCWLSECSVEKEP